MGYAVFERLRRWWRWNILCPDDNLNLSDVRVGHGVWRGQTCLHGTVVNLQAVELFGSLRCSGGLCKCESGNTAALAIWSVREFNLLDCSDGL
jgi:hypothetical protein